jgi:hypothetical protein
VSDKAKVLQAVARLSAEHLSCLVKLSEAWLRRDDGLAVPDKLLIIMTADLQHMKALHKVTQVQIQGAEQDDFSKLLRRLADAEEVEEMKEKGGATSADLAG